MVVRGELQLCRRRTRVANRSRPPLPHGKRPSVRIREIASRQRAWSQTLALKRTPHPIATDLLPPRPMEPPAVLISTGACRSPGPGYHIRCSDNHSARADRSGSRSPRPLTWERCTTMLPARRPQLGKSGVSRSWDLPCWSWRPTAHPRAPRTM